jgi:mono/diheme cytochrome c family protein
VTWWPVRTVIVGVPLILLLVHGVGATSQVSALSQAADIAAVAAGRNTFGQFCAPCHGVTATGNGPVASMLLSRPADLTQIRRRNNGTFPRADLEALIMFGAKTQTLAHGSDQMPVWGSTFTSIDGTSTGAQSRVQAVLAFLDSIQQ